MFDPAKLVLRRSLPVSVGLWAAALDEGGERLYLGGTDFTVLAFELLSLPEQPVGVFRGHRSYVTAVECSPALHRVVSAGLDGLLFGWQPGRAEPAWKVDSGSRVQRLALSPDGETVFAALDDLTVGSWSAANGKPVRLYDGGHAPRTVVTRKNLLYSVAVSPSGRLLAAGDRAGAVTVREVATGALLRTLDAKKLYTQGLYDNPLPGNQSSEYEWGGVRSLTFLAENRLIAGGMGPADHNSAGIDGLMMMIAFDPLGDAPPVQTAVEKRKGILYALRPAAGSPWAIGAGGGGGAGTGGSGSLVAWTGSERPEPVSRESKAVLRDLRLSADGRRLWAVGSEKSLSAGRIEAWEIP